MDTRKIYRHLAGLLFLASLLGVNCKKQELDCPKSGYEYTYFKPGVSYTPGSDSILLGSQIVIEASVPKTFFDSEHNVMLTLDASEISGPLSVSKAISTPFLSFAGAVEDVELLPSFGTLTKDSMFFSQGQLLSFRTAHWDGGQPDSFRLKIDIKPKVRGTYFVSLRDQGAKDKDCALFKYLPTVKNADQHFYLMTPITNGQISEIAINYVYCFKVY